MHCAKSLSTLHWRASTPSQVGYSPKLDREYQNFGHVRHNGHGSSSAGTTQSWASRKQSRDGRCESYYVQTCLWDTNCGFTLSVLLTLSSRTFTSLNIRPMC